MNPLFFHRTGFGPSRSSSPEGYKSTVTLFHLGSVLRLRVLHASLKLYLARHAMAPVLPLLLLLLLLLLLV